jgi:P-type E1-E2 ATPase
MGVLWSGFGYNMKVYGPITVLNFLHIMAKNGVLIKDGRSLEMLQQIDTVVFDKTGTLTDEQPRLRSVYGFGPFDEATVLTYAAAAERRQSHPIARAIQAAARERGLTVPTIDEAAYRVGYGIEVRFSQRFIQVGSLRFMQQHGVRLNEKVRWLQSESNANGTSLVYVAVDGTLAGVLELEPCLRPEAKRIIDNLKARGIEPYIISGDHEQPTRRLAIGLGIENYFAETLPAEKAELIAQLRADGRFVAYIGDGLNDSIALNRANVSISLKGASTAATDTAQIILMDGDLQKLENLFDISGDFERSMRFNYLNSIVPGVVTLGGILFFNLGLPGSMAIYFSSKLYGLMHCMLPLVKEEAQGEAADVGQEQIRDDGRSESHRDIGLGDTRDRGGRGPASLEAA